MTFSSSKDSETAKSISESDQASRYQPGSVEFSAPLETSVPLEAPRVIYGSPPVSQPLASEPVAAKVIDSIAAPLLEPPVPDPQPVMTPVIEPTSELALETSLPHPATFSTEVSTQVAAEEKFQLLAERLVVDLHKRKVGEIVVRKEVETRIIEIPIRREKLIVEQVNPDYKQLAIVDLGGSPETEFNVQDLVQIHSEPMVRGTFTSPESAMQFLAAIAADAGLHPQAIQISIIPQDSSSPAAYESLLDQHSHRS